ncbi:MAG: hypothetical protein J0H68_09735 [Sphingobacteriia bacterium]|nr:hypothetical protein [Sphingobacteriia bacterium]
MFSNVIPKGLTFIDLLIVGVYLAATLFYGIYKGRNVKTVKEFAVGDGKFIAPVLLATIAATWIGGGSTFGSVESVYKYGISYFVIFLGDVISVLIISEIFVSKIYKFKGLISAGEIMESFFGKPARVITGISSTFIAAGWLGLQIIAIGYLFHSFFNITPFTGALIGSGIVVIYSAFGGIKSVTYTDIIQFYALAIGIPLACYLGLEKVGGYQGLIQQLPTEHLKIFPSYLPKWKVIYLLIIWAIPSLFPQLIQRILMAKDSSHAINSFRLTAAVFVPFYFVVATIGLIAFVLNPELEPKLAMPYVITDVLPNAAKGILLAGLFAVLMSTADSALNVIALNVVHDVIKPLSKNDLNPKTELLWIKLATVFLGFGVVYIASFTKSLFEIIILIQNFWLPVITFPLMCGVWGFKGTLRTFIISGIIGGFTAISWNVLELESNYAIGSVLPALFANMISYTILTLIDRHLGFVEYEKQNNQSKFQNKLIKLFNPVLSFIFSPIKSIINFSNERVKIYGANYISFGAFAVYNYAIPFFMWSPQAININKSYDLIIRTISALLCINLLLKDYWPEKLKKFFPTYWHLTLMFCFPVSTTYFFLNYCTNFWILNLALSLFALSILVDWLSFIILQSFGTYFGFIMYKALHNNAAIHLSNEQIFNISYISIFAILMGLIFTRYKEKPFEQSIKYEIGKRESIDEAVISALSIPTRFLNNLSHETKTPVQGILTAIEFLNNDWEKLTQEAKSKILSTLKADAARLESYHSNILDKAKYIVGKVDLFITHENLNNLVEQTLLNIKESARNKNLSIETVFYEEINLKIDKEKIEKIILSLIHNAIKFNKENGSIKIELNLIDNNILFAITDTGIGIPKEELEVIFEPFYESSRTKSNAGGRGLSLSISKNIIEAHGGKIWAEHNYPEGSIIKFILPYNKNEN